VRVLSADWVVPVEGAPIRDGAVAIDDAGIITAVGASSDLGTGDRYPESVILPGFVNSHSHLEYAVYTGFGDGLDFPAWIGLHVQRKRRLDFGDMEAIARLGALECLRSGITTVGDCSFSGAAAGACADVGLRGVVYLEVFGETAEPIATSFEPTRERIAGVLSEDVRLGVSPHAPYTCALELYGACNDLGLPVATHLAESEAETQFLRTGAGPRVLAAHCVQADAEEIEILAAHDVAVAHCPRSNALLGCGVAPLRELREAGLRVSIATDSPASTPSFDMFDEMRAAIAGARARERRPDALSAADALELATLGGARALGLEEKVGSLAPGKSADLTVLSLAETPFIPWEDPVTAAVLGGSPERVVATLVSGRPRYEKGGKTWHELIGAARNARSRLLSHDAPTS
jgi:cytosine/adenosine deaminase-related metal-dependent hydrolase